MIRISETISLHTDLRTQNGKLNRPFSLSGVRKDGTKPPTWHKKNGHNVECYHWIYEFRYNDDRSKGFDIYVNDYDKFIGKKDII